MLDSFEILTTSGVVLWSKHYAPVGVNIINSLIKDVFIEENLAAASTSSGDDSAERNAPYKKDKYTLKWTMAKDLGLVFVAVYQSLIQLSWIDKLLDNVRILFTALYRDQFKKPLTSEIECPFDEYFDRQVQELEKTLRAMPTAPVHLPATASNSVPSIQVDAEEESAPPVPGMRKSAPKAIDSDATSNETTPIATPDTSRPNTPNAGVITGKAAPGSRTSRRDKRALNQSRNTSRDLPGPGKGDAKKPAEKKKMRTWDAFGNMDEGEDQVLDYSASDANGAATTDARHNGTAPLEAIPQASFGRKTNKGEVVLKDLDEEMDSILADAAASKEKTSATAAASSGLVGSGISAISGLFRNVVGGKTLTAQDLEKPLRAMEDHLIRKNVARDAAEHLCQSVQRDLVGTTTPSFTSIDTAIRASMDSALSRILTPTSGSTLDLLRSINAVINNSDPAKRRPYVVSVVGVNGVGKSTTLSKLAFLLLHNNMRVLVAAADTFRSGAVEQLRVHVDRLQQLTKMATDNEQLGSIDLYERGYGKDAASVARDAVSFAAGGGKDRAFDVVLIDTAGRRHNDTRLMSSLAPFARAANPDKILMVGEALVGTDSVAQARHFNESFGPGRGLDGFIVSKCDTVGEMVGTLVSLVWSTGVPVVAVGVGQHYGDLRGFRVAWARDLLLQGG